jgi:hypothetical protein
MWSSGLECLTRHPILSLTFVSVHHRGIESYLFARWALLINEMLTFKLKCQLVCGPAPRSCTYPCATSVPRTPVHHKQTVRLS